MDLIKKLTKKIKHKHALIFFWTCVGVFLFGPLLAISLTYIDPIKFESFVNHPIFIMLGVASFLCMFPVMILIPLIGGGYFKKNNDTWINPPYSCGGKW